MFVCKWLLKISPFMTTKLTHHFFNCYFPSWKFALGSSLSFQIGIQELYMPWYTQKLQLPCKANGLLDQVDSSLDLLISLKVPKSTRSQDPFFFPVLFSLLYLYEMLASSPSKMYLSYMRLYIVQQFLIFTENVENASLFWSETCLHKLSNTNVILYKIVWYSKDLGIAGYLPTARESYDGLSLQSEKFCDGCAVPWSTFWRHGPAFKSTLKL